MTFQDLFPSLQPLIACIHLLPLPGSPRYGGTMRQVYDTALAEAEIFTRYAVDGLIVENFRDMPFYPRRLPAETVAALATETRDVTERGLVDAIIVSGDATGEATNPDDIDLVRQHTTLPVLLGSGATPDNLPHVFAKVDGLIVGSYFKHHGKADNLVQESRVKAFAEALRALRNTARTRDSRATRGGRVRYADTST